MEVDGVELLRMIRDGEIKNRTKIKQNIKIYEYDASVGTFFDNENHELLFNACKSFVNTKFEIISKEEEDYIDKLSKIQLPYSSNDEDSEFLKLLEKYKIIDAINANRDALKQLNRKINKEYCNNCGVELTEDNKVLPNMCNECKYGIEGE